MVWEVGEGSVEHTIKTKVGCFSHNNLGLKGGQKNFHNFTITASKKLVEGTHLTIGPKKQKTVVIFKMCPFKP